MGSTLSIGAVPAVAPVRVRGAALAAAVLLLAVAIQGWPPQVLDRSSPAPAPAPAIDRASAIDRAPAIGVEAPVEQARHGFEPVPGRPGTLRVGDTAYRAVLDGAGVQYRPAGSSGALGISVSSVVRGSEAAVLEQGPWAATSVRNRASRPLAAGVTEQVSARTGEVQWDVVLDRAPAGRGDLVVSAGLTGVTGAVERGTHAGRPVWRLPMDGGERVRLGEVVVLDARGAELHRGLPEIDGGELRLVVPGDVLDQARYPVTVDPTAGPETFIRGGSVDPAVAYDGTNHLVVWTEPLNGGTGIIRGAIVQANGTVGSPFDISTRGDSRQSSEPDVAWNGSQYLVTWMYHFSSTDRDVYSRFVSAAGVPGATVPITTSVKNVHSPAVAGGGSNFIVSWIDDTVGVVNTNGEWNVWVNRVTNEGVKQDGSAGADLFPSFRARKRADAAWNGTRWLVVEVEDDDEPQPPGGYGDQVNPTGPLAPSAPIPVGVFSVGEQDNATVASDGNGWLVAYDHRPTSTEQLDVIARRIDASGAPVGDHLPLGTGPLDQRDPSVAWNGVYFVAWRQPTSGPNDLWGNRVTSDGAVLDGAAGVDLLNTPSSDEVAPALAQAPGYGKWTMVYVTGGQTIVERPLSK
jgi:hypothetical protein